MFFALIGAGLFCYWGFYLLALLFIDCDLQLAFYERFGKSIRRLQGKVVFVTGASSGIGEHTAIALARHGVKLVLAARRESELQRVKQQCIRVSNGALTEADVLVLPMDMLDIQSHKRHFATAVSYFGRVDILFNNAGRSQRAEWEKIHIDVDRQLFELNVFSVVNLSRIAMEHFKQTGGGHIAVTSSLAGVIGVPNSGSYTGGKHAIHGYMNSLRTEKSGQNIAVSLFCPGPTMTNFLQECATDSPNKKYGIAAQPTDRRMSGERCGELCAIGLANKAGESWMALFPLIPFAYTAVYFPNVFNAAVKVMGPERIFRARDGRSDNVPTEDKKS